MVPTQVRSTLLVVSVVAMALALNARSVRSQPSHLTCESLTTPLGMDEPRPALSWQLQDERRGAAQTAYEIEVATSAAKFTSDSPDVWDSGQIRSAQSVGIRYAGPTLKPFTRYYWRVKAWDREGKLYPASDFSWWETGLLDPVNWQAKWISYEDDEHRSVRTAKAEWIVAAASAGAPSSRGGERHSYFRFKFSLASDVHVVKLHIAGRDTVAAWINGKQVVQHQAEPAWKDIPWQAYSVYNITQTVHNGSNTFAADVLEYNDSSAGSAPLSATIYAQLTDGGIVTYSTSAIGWKSSRNPMGRWTESEFDDSTWPPAEADSGRNGSRNIVAGNPWATGPVAALRRTFIIAKPVASARLYATSMGAYKFRLNGITVGDQILSPGWMDFRLHVAYQAYDVTAALRMGRNAIAVQLAPGWYSTPLLWVLQPNIYGEAQPNNYGTSPRSLRAQLRIEHEDGTIEWVNTDESWKADDSPTTSAEIYNGETFDAQSLQPGWDTANFDDKSWHAVELPEIPKIAIEWQSFPPIRVERELTAKSMSSPHPGMYVFDFGQNLAGVAHIRTEGPAGTVVQLRFAEITNRDGTIYTGNLRNARATDRFILAGKGLEEFQPNFTFHGFRYVEVTGLPQKPALDSVKAVVFHTDAPFTVKLQSDNKILNQLWSNILWGQRSNFIGVPTDCPQRDERLGWSGDAQVFWRAAVFNMGIAAFSRKFAADLRGTQTGTTMYGQYAPGVHSESDGFAAGWSDAGVIIPWTAWVQFGDKRIVEQNWGAMQKYLSGIEAANPDYLWRLNVGNRYGDWLSPEGITAEDLVATAFWAYDTTLMAQMAHALGHVEDEQRYLRNFKKIKAAFIKAYVRDDGTVGPSQSSFASIPAPGDVAGSLLKESQTAYVLALHMNLLPEGLRAKAAQHLVRLLEANQWRLGTGFLGTPYLLAALTNAGYGDVAYRLLLGTHYPSWGYLVEQGATTMWERWNGDQKMGDPTMNSYNHYAYGAVADWIYRYAAGIDTTTSAPGFQEILLHPNFNSQLGWLNFWYESPYGRIHSEWQVAGGKAVWHLTIPANARAELPLTTQQSEQYTLNGKALSSSDEIRVSHKSGDQISYRIPAGTYTFEIKLSESHEQGRAETSRSSSAGRSG